jgi:predicted O-linked N-acetylglucosamine transferase (SPINDLY family)
MTANIDENKVDEQIEYAISLQKERKFTQAKLIYESLLKINSNQFKIFYLLGTLEAQIGNFDKSIDYLLNANKINSNSWEVNSNLGNAYIEVNDFKMAVKFYNKSIKINQYNKNLFYSCGIAYGRLEQHANAVRSYKKALNLDPSYKAANLQLAISQVKLSKFKSAFENFKILLVDEPENSEINFQYGVALLLSENYVEAIIYLENSIKLKTDFSEAYLILGDAYRALNKNLEAIEKYNNSISLNDKNYTSFYNLSLALIDCKKYKEALINIERVLELRPNFDQAYNALGVLYINLGDFNLAYDNLSKAIELNPVDPSYFLNRGNVLSTLRRFNECLLDYDKAIELKSDYAQAYCNSGYVLLNNLFNTESALVFFDVAIGLQPNLTQALVNRAECFVRLGQFQRALDDFLKALEQDGGSEYTLGKCLHYKMKICDWSNLNDGILICESMLEDHLLAAVPFETLNFFDNPHLHLRSAELFNAHKALPNNHLGEFKKRNSNPIVKVGYFSADLYFHPVSIWLTEQLENHDKTKVELYAFCLKPVQDLMRDRLEAAFDHWVDVTNMSDVEVANLSRELEIDVAIDLNGHTGDGRPGIFAARAAPIQLNHLGFPGSMGAEYIDYLIFPTPRLDEDLAELARNRQFITEKIAYVPSSYTYDRQRQLSDEPLTRAQFGLPETGFVFTCQNGCQKLLPEVFDVWMEILKAVPGSVLWLLRPNETAVKNLIKEANARGVEAERLIFTTREVVPIDQEKARIAKYLASYKLADLFLDTWPYNAGTTAIDALWAGLPVLTKEGKAPVARMAAGALRGIEVPELITRTPQAYQELAIELAHSPERLKQLKEKVQANRLTTALFDPVANTRHIENAFLEMHRRYKAGLAPEDLYIKE